MTKANHKMHSKAGRVLALPSIDDDDDILMEGKILALCRPVTV